MLSALLSWACTQSAGQRGADFKHTMNIFKLYRVLTTFLRVLHPGHLLGNRNGWLTGMALLILMGCAQDSVPVKRENIVGRWRSQRGWFTLSFYPDGRFKKQEQEDGLRLLTGGFFMLDSDSRWSLSGEKLTAGRVVFKIRRLTPDTMVIQFGDDPSFRFRRVESDVPGLDKNAIRKERERHRGVRSIGRRSSRRSDVIQIPGGSVLDGGQRGQR